MSSLDRYFEEPSEWIPRRELSTKTRMNLAYLEEERGFQFESVARQAKFGVSPSYLIYGHTPEGEEAIYERRETMGRGAGQSYLWIEGKRHRLGKFGLPIVSPTSLDKGLPKGDEIFSPWSLIWPRLDKMVEERESEILLDLPDPIGRSKMKEILVRLEGVPEWEEERSSILEERRELWSRLEERDRLSGGLD